MQIFPKCVILSAGVAGAEGSSHQLNERLHKKRWRWFLRRGTFSFRRESTQRAGIGERPDRRRWWNKGGERVAAVGKTRACFDRRSGCRVPQQECAELIAPAIKAALPSCCGTLCAPRRERQRCTQTAATRSGRFIRHRRRSHRFPSRRALPMVQLFSLAF